VVPVRAEIDLAMAVLSGGEYCVDGNHCPKTVELVSATQQKSPNVRPISL
jgi:hypothetical protein